jgi:hypothetical protein
MMGTIGILFVVAACAIGYGMYFQRRAQIAKAGGLTAHSRAYLDKLFELPADERVTAAWSAVTVPKLSTGQKAVEVASAVAGAIGIAGVKFVGRPLALAFTSKDRLMVLDREDGGVRAFGPGARPVFSDTGKKGTKRTSETKFGWHDGAIVSLAGLAADPMEIDVLASAVPLLVGWSRGDAVSALDGPYPSKGTI